MSELEQPPPRERGKPMERALLLLDWVARRRSVGALLSTGIHMRLSRPGGIQIPPGRPLLPLCRREQVTTSPSAARCSEGNVSGPTDKAQADPWVLVHLFVLKHDPHTPYYLKKPEQVLAGRNWFPIGGQRHGDA